MISTGEILPIGSDWGLVDAKGGFAVDAFYQLRTTDNVDIFGRSRGPPQASGLGDQIKTVITLETGDEKYYWLNNILVVGVTTVGDGFITIDAWQVTLP
ncbi:hypothetical protein DHEL01_v202984 [Diaporthe helianthi]|uniref:Uncharacterized protein n=1 Tax=Diaporthe helianthi TaxID=158607 RepID=A0A2P5I7W6_DIAHE|nr:hypothetical protein DHEL01_v202984 [Diaporthe helianthi]